MEKETFITEEGYKKIVAELERLRIKRKEIASRIQEAKDLGDLSENAEYHEAKNDQAFTEGRIVEVEAMLNNAKIIQKPAIKSEIQIGSTVSVQIDHRTITYTIVGSNEANPKEGLISNESPLGKAFLGKKIGDTFSVYAPKGEVTYTVKEIM